MTRDIHPGILLTKKNKKPHAVYDWLFDRRRFLALMNMVGTKQPWDATSAIGPQPRKWQQGVLVGHWGILYIDIDV